MDFIKHRDGCGNIFNHMEVISGPDLIDDPFFEEGDPLLWEATVSFVEGEGEYDVEIESDDEPSEQQCMQALLDDMGISY